MVEEGWKCHSQIRNPEKGRERCPKTPHVIHSHPLKDENQIANKTIKNWNKRVTTYILVRDSGSGGQVSEQ